jgi:tetratricopeptide (TPR) repeat protein
MYYWARRYQKAIEQLQKTVEMEPGLPLGHQFLGHAYEQKGMVEEALAEFHKAATLSEGRSVYEINILKEMKFFNFGFTT